MNIIFGQEPLFDLRENGAKANSPLGMERWKTKSTLPPNSPRVQRT